MCARTMPRLPESLGRLAKPELAPLIMKASVAKRLGYSLLYARTAKIIKYRIVHCAEGGERVHALWIWAFVTWGLLYGTGGKTQRGGIIVYEVEGGWYNPAGFDLNG